MFSKSPCVSHESTVNKNLSRISRSCGYSYSQRNWLTRLQLAEWCMRLQMNQVTHFLIRRKLLCLFFCVGLRIQGLATIEVFFTFQTIDGNRMKFIERIAEESILKPDHFHDRHLFMIFKWHPEKVRCVVGWTNCCCAFRKITMTLQNSEIKAPLNFIVNRRALKLYGTALGNCSKCHMFSVVNSR